MHDALSALARLIVASFRFLLWWVPGTLIIASVVAVGLQYVVTGLGVAFVFALAFPFYLFVNQTAAGAFSAVFDVVEAEDDNG
jgi:hypothetical protein